FLSYVFYHALHTSPFRTGGFCSSAVAHRALHSFPTRRSSDLFVSMPLFWFNYTEKKECMIYPLQILTNRCHKYRYRSATDKSYIDRKSTRLNSSHVKISYAVFCLNKQRQTQRTQEHTYELPPR